jgi:hypothetical protein
VLANEYANISKLAKHLALDCHWQYGIMECELNSFFVILLGSVSSCGHLANIIRTFYKITIKIADSLESRPLAIPTDMHCQTKLLPPSGLEYFNKRRVANAFAV